MSLLNLIFLFSFSSLADTPILECDYNTPQVQLEFKLYGEKDLKLTGKVLNQAFHCDLKLEEVTDLRRSRGPESFRINSRREDKDCSPKLSLKVKQGLEDQVDILVLKESAKAFVFEGHTPVTCNSITINESALKDLSKLPKKKHRAEYSNRTTHPFDFLETQTSQKIKP